MRGGRICKIRGAVPDGSWLGCADVDRDVHSRAGGLHGSAEANPGPRSGAICTICCRDGGLDLERRLVAAFNTVSRPVECPNPRECAEHPD